MLILRHRESKIRRERKLTLICRYVLIFAQLYARIALVNRKGGPTVKNAFWKKSAASDADRDSVRELKDGAKEKKTEAEETVEDILGESPDSGEYYTVPNVNGNLVWSVLSLISAVLSVVLFSFFYIGGIIAAVAAIALAVVSSRKLGFFDRMALFGLIFGIFGLVFGVFSMVLDITGVLDNLK